MKERPILFSAPMIRALLSGAKTQTRRVVKDCLGVNNGVPFTSVSVGPATSGIAEIACPYGKSGDHLWVREAFMHEPADYCWEASVSIPCRPAVTIYRADCEGGTDGAGWKPSIHMPRSLSRITLEVTGVRLERLGDISEADAIAEGIGSIRVSENDSRWLNYCDPESKAAAFGDPRHSFWSLWESINGRESRDANPFVWVVEFKRM